MIVCVIFTNSVYLNLLLNNGKLALAAAFSCFRTFLLLVSVSLIPDQFNHAELFIPLYIAWALPDLRMLRMTTALGFEANVQYTKIYLMCYRVCLYR